MPGAISGPLLGEAAHRLLKNSLQMKSNGAGLLDPPYRNSPNIMNNRPRPAGPSGYERGFTQDYYHAHYQHLRGNPNMRPAPPSNEVQLGNRQNFRTEDRLPLQEHYQNLGTGFGNMTIEDGSRFRHQTGMMQPQMQNAGFNQMYPNRYLQTSGPPPRPPTNWIDKPIMTGKAAMYHRQEIMLPGGGYDKQSKKVYQARARSSQNPSDSGFRQ